MSTAQTVSLEPAAPELGAATVRILTALRDGRAERAQEADTGHPLRVFACGHDGMEGTSPAGDALVLLCPRCRADWRAGRGFVEVVRLFTPRE
jgi:hypothetical protein